jgi:hypothetical protein
MNDEIQIAFDLPGQPGVRIRGVVCWLSDSTAGIRFEPPDQPSRDVVRKWIDEYLEII